MTGTVNDRRHTPTTVNGFGKENEPRHTLKKCNIKTKRRRRGRSGNGLKKQFEAIAIMPSFNIFCLVLSKNVREIKIRQASNGQCRTASQLSGWPEKKLNARLGITSDLPLIHIINQNNSNPPRSISLSLTVLLDGLVLFLAVSLPVCR